MLCDLKCHFFPLLCYLFALSLVSIFICEGLKFKRRPSQRAKHILTVGLLRDQPHWVIHRLGLQRCTSVGGLYLVLRSGLRWNN